MAILGYSKKNNDIREIPPPKIKNTVLRAISPCHVPCTTQSCQTQRIVLHAPDIPSNVIDAMCRLILYKLYVTALDVDI